MRRLGCIALVIASFACASPGPPRRARFPFESLRAEMFSPPQVLAGAQRPKLVHEANAVVLALDEESSFRAVTSALVDVRQRDLAVAYWIDLAHTPRLARLHPEWVEGGPNSVCVPISSAEGFAAQLERVAALLRERPPADAIFLCGLSGSPLECGCAFAICEPQASFDAAAPARFVAAVRGYAGGAPVVPVASNAAPSSLRGQLCASRACVAKGCAAREDQVWSTLRAHSPKIAVVLLPPSESEDPTNDCVRALKHWSRAPAPVLPASFAPTTGTLLLAVLPASAFGSANLAPALSAVQLAADGYVISYCVNAAAGLGAITAEAASPSARD